MGEEYGETRPFQFFTDHAEPLGSAVSAGRMSEFGGHGWEDLYGGDVVVPDPQDPANLLRTRSFAPRPRTHCPLKPRSSPGVNASWPPAASRSTPTRGCDTLCPSPKASARQLTMTGPVTIHANLSDEPMRIRGPVLGTFGTVEAEADHFVLQPDAVALVNAAQSTREVPERRRTDGQEESRVAGLANGDASRQRQASRSPTSTARPLPASPATSTTRRALMEQSRRVTCPISKSDCSPRAAPREAAPSCS